MLNAGQWVAIEWLAQVKNGGKTQDEIAELCGVTRKTLWQWRRDDEFQQELKREMVRHTGDRLPDILNAMADSAITHKSAAAAKLILQANDILVDQVRIEAKVKEAVDVETLRARIAALQLRAE